MPTGAARSRAFGTHWRGSTPPAKQRSIPRPRRDPPRPRRRRATRPSPRPPAPPPPPPRAPPPPRGFFFFPPPPPPPPPVHISFVRCWTTSLALGVACGRRLANGIAGWCRQIAGNAPLAV